ncbi:MAG: polysaccharide deacetylase family protein [Thermoleophilaceae bacterium]
MIERLKKLGALALIPLSVVPVVLSVPKVEDEYAQFEDAYLNRDALPAPEVAPRDWEPVRVPGGRVPVLTYHGIEERPSSPYSITRDEFARQMAMLDELGFATIGIETYTRWLGGEDVDLPEKPILVTFDDGQLDSFRGADAVLERHGFEATMFAMSGEAGERGGFYSTWDELLAMRDSGRWHIQLHAGHGHHAVPTGPDSEGPFYANRAWNGAEAGLESFGSARDRIIGDILWGKREMRDQMPGFESHAFAVPFSEFGQHHTNDRRIPEMLRPWLAHQFEVIFVQSEDPPFSRAGGATDMVFRFEIRRDTSTEELHDWLGRYGSGR